MKSSKKMAGLVLALVIFFSASSMAKNSQLAQLEQIFAQQKVAAPPILQLSDKELRQPNAAQIVEQKISEMAAAVRQQIYSDSTSSPILRQPIALPKNFGADKNIVIAGALSQEFWTLYHLLVFKEMYNLLSLDRLYFLITDNVFLTPEQRAELTQDPRIVLVGSLTKENLMALGLALSSQSQLENIFRSVHTHGGGFVSDSTDGGPRTCQPIYSWPELSGNIKNKVYPSGYESDIKLGVLRNQQEQIIPFKKSFRDISMICQNFPQYPNDLFRVCRIDYAPGSFFENHQGQKIAPLIKRYFFAAGSDQNGYFICGGTTTGQSNWLERLESSIDNYPDKIEDVDSLDLDQNGIFDIPLAIISGTDTLLAVDMNQGQNYVPFTLTADAIDKNKNGLIGDDNWIDFNGNGLIDQIYIPTVMKMHGDEPIYLIDYEWQEFSNLLPATARKIDIFHFCHAGGFAEYSGPNSLFFSSMPRDMTASLSTYPIDEFPEAIKAGKHSWLEIINYVHSGFPYHGVPNIINTPGKLRFLDNPNLPAAAGPWPNNGQGFKAANFFPTLLPSTAIAADKKPMSFELAQNYPNPFNPQTTINYSLLQPGRVSLIISDLRGRLIGQLVNETKKAGAYQIVFDASQLASGFYLCRLKIGGFSKTIKMMVQK